MPNDGIVTVLAKRLAIALCSPCFFDPQTCCFMILTRLCCLISCFSGVLLQVHTCLEGSCDNPTHAILYAWDANTLAPLWNSDRPADALAGAVKFTFPTIANGRVYTHGQYGVDVFGLK